MPPGLWGSLSSVQDQHWGCFALLLRPGRVCAPFSSSWTVKLLLELGAPPAWLLLTAPAAPDFINEQSNICRILKKKCRGNSEQQKKPQNGHLFSCPITFYLLQFILSVFLCFLLFSPFLLFFCIPQIG